jgi:hypothetical protein
MKIKTQIERVLINILNGKGGQGKTLIAAIIAEWMLFQLLTYTLLDCDENLSLSKLLPQAKRHDLKHHDGIELLISRIMDSRVTLADTPANISKELDTLFSNVNFGPSLDSINGKLIAVVPVTADDPAGWDEAWRLINSLQLLVTYVVVKNDIGGSDFSLFDGSATRQAFERAGASVLHLPKFDDNLRRWLAVERLTLCQFIGKYWEVLKINPAEAFRMAVPAQRATKHIEDIFGQLNAIAPQILPDSEISKIRPISTDALKEFFICAWIAKKQFSPLATN